MSTFRYTGVAYQLSDVNSPSVDSSTNIGVSIIATGVYDAYRGALKCLPLPKKGLDWYIDWTDIYENED